MFVASALISFSHVFSGHILLLFLMHIKNAQELWELILSWCLDGFLDPIYQNNFCVISKLGVQGSNKKFPLNSEVWFSKKKIENPIYYSYYNGKAFLPYVFLPAMLRVFDWICLILNKHPIKDAFAFTILSLWKSKIVRYVFFLKTKSLTESFNLTIQICILNLFYLFWISLGY